MAQCLRRAIVELRQIGEDGLGAIEQARAHVVLAQRQQGLHALLVVDVRALHQPLVQADGAVDLATAAKQMAERDLGLEGVLVEFRDVQEQLDGLVRLLVEQVVQAAEIGGGQATDLVIAVAFAAAAPDDPADQGGQRNQQEVPETTRR